jgi:hypothetical protein
MPHRASNYSLLRRKGEKQRSISAAQRRRQLTDSHTWHRMKHH